MQGGGLRNQDRQARDVDARAELLELLGRQLFQHRLRREVAAVQHDRHRVALLLGRPDGQAPVAAHELVKCIQINQAADQHLTRFLANTLGQQRGVGVGRQVRQHRRVHFQVLGGRLSHHVFRQRLGHTHGTPRAQQQHNHDIGAKSRHRR